MSDGTLILDALRNIDAEVVFDTLRGNVHPLLEVVKEMIADMNE